MKGAGVSSLTAQAEHWARVPVLKTMAELEDPPPDPREAQGHTDCWAYSA